MNMRTPGRRCSRRIHQYDRCFIPRKHVNTVKAGLLARNIFAVLPVPVRGQWTTRAKTFSLHTVAGQLVIFTQFPIISGYYPGDLIRLMKEIRKNFVYDAKLAHFRLRLQIFFLFVF